MKTCSKCGETKPLDGFAKNKSKPDGLQCWCKVCQKKYDRKYYAKNREKVNKTSREAYTANPEKAKKRGQEYYEAHPEKVKKSAWAAHLKTKYGLTPEDYQALLDGQGGGCAICGKTESQEGRRLHVDHRKAPWLIRGILCCGCNTAIGGLRHDPAVLALAIEYLQKYQSASTE